MHPKLVGSVFDRRRQRERVKEENNTSKKNLVYFQIIHKHNLQYKNANTCQKYKKTFLRDYAFFNLYIKLYTV